MLLWVDRWYVNFAVDGQVGESPTRLVAYEFRAAACICASPRGRGRNYARNSDRSLVSFVSEVSWSINFREIVSLFFCFYSKFFNLVFLLPLFHEGMEEFRSDPARRRKYSEILDQIFDGSFHFQDRRRRDLEEEIRDGDVYSDEGGLEIVVAVPRGNGTDPGEREGGSSREEAGLVPTAPRLPSRRYFEGIYPYLDVGSDKT